MFEITILGLIVLGIGFYNGNFPRWYEVQRLNKIIDRAKKEYGDGEFSPGVLLIGSAGLYGSTPVDHRAIRIFINTAVKDSALIPQMTTFHEAFVGSRPTKIGVSPATESGQWNTIMYVYRYHTVVFYLSME